MVFASLVEESEPVSAGGHSDKGNQVGRDYVRGIRDSYDLVNGLVTGLVRVEKKSGNGTLTTAELGEFTACARRTCDALMAFALASGVGDAVPELVDINGLLEAALLRLGLGDEPGVDKHYSDGLPSVKTVRKMLDVGIGLLIKGCLEQSPGGVGITTARGSDGTSVVVTVKESSRSRPLTQVASLRDVADGGGTQRETALFLLSRLPKECHNVQAKHVDGFFHFSMIVGSPINEET